MKSNTKDAFLETTNVKVDSLKIDAVDKDLQKNKVFSRKDGKYK